MIWRFSAGPLGSGLRLGCRWVHSGLKVSVSTYPQLYVVFLPTTQPGLVVCLLPPGFWREAIDFPLCLAKPCLTSLLLSILKRCDPEEEVSVALSKRTWVFVVRIWAANNDARCMFCGHNACPVSSDIFPMGINWVLFHQLCASPFLRIRQPWPCLYGAAQPLLTSVRSALELPLAWRVLCSHSSRLWP